MVKRRIPLSRPLPEFIIVKNSHWIFLSWSLPWLIIIKHSHWIHMSRMMHLWIIKGLLCWLMHLWIIEGLCWLLHLWIIEGLCWLLHLWIIEGLCWLLHLRIIVETSHYVPLPWVLPLWIQIPEEGCHSCLYPRLRVHCTMPLQPAELHFKGWGVVFDPWRLLRTVQYCGLAYNQFTANGL